MKKTIYINNQPFEVVEVGNIKNISYEQIALAWKLPLGATIFYMTTKYGKDDFKAGILEPKQTLDIVDGLSISAMVAVDGLN